MLMSMELAWPDGAGMESSILSTLADDGTAIVTVLGEIDFANSGQLAQRLRATVTDWSPATVRVDLAQASFIDSTGLGALIEGYQAAGEVGIEYIVVNPTDVFRRVLTVTGLAEFFGLTAGETAAEVEEEAAQATGA
jgi:anti-sigma B factor antagonist